MKICFGLLLAISHFAVATCGISEDSNWPQWRGPSGTGKTSATDVPSTWGPELNVQWRVDLPEAGNSTPIVWGERIFLTQPISESNLRTLICFDRQTGRESWRRGIAYAGPESSHRTNPFCSSSPVTDGQRVIAWFGSAGLVCFDFDGNELWRRDLGKQNHMWGYGSSPILYKDLCLLNFGPGEREFMIAVDKFTGETRWEIDSIDDEAERMLSGPENDGSANDFSSDKPRSERLRGSWNTPIIVHVDGTSNSGSASGHDELIVAFPRRVEGLDPLTGARLWTSGDAAPLAYASPMQSGDTIVVLGGYGGASLAVRVGGQGDVTRSHQVWHRPRDKGWLGTGVAHDGAIYISGLEGILSCIDVLSGDELWRKRIGGGGTWASITQTDDGRMFLLDKSGRTTVFAPNRDKYEEIAVNELNEPTNASVVIAGNDLLIRTDRALWSFGSGTPPRPSESN
ncbi:outer membrane protein assembly factor BamB family protein [Allorhodopirellula heiligendammensis]|uniref:Outer membrane protein assembly factor BamB n=1 Tax=Allorhodopirellula heiligendammensis TaxID=2714739 RepID=A0A5C6BG31_9BACT|nr:PQQ-binding-like beta-propeller repeat protein [Allorhodopirellula heiligendammensis]TWU10910.1 Outer membrane protein assembly factor BamB [Allorhodopirellula heiligendammensis]